MASVCRTIRRNITRYKHDVVSIRSIMSVEDRLNVYGYESGINKAKQINVKKSIWSRILDWFKGVLNV